MYNERVPFTEQAGTSAFLHTTVSYEWNGTGATQKIALKILNATNFKEFQGHRYNLTTSQVAVFKESLMVPNLSYKIAF